MEDLARHLHRSQDVDETLAMLTKSAVEAIDGVDYASITVREDEGHLRTLAPTHRVVTAIDELQYELREGPCYETVSDGDASLIVADLAQDPRWSRFGPRAAQRGIGAMLVFELVSDGRSRTALNLYAERPCNFEGAVEMAELFASHAKLVMGYARTVKKLDETIRSRTVIGQAIGILMERFDLGEDQAFGFLTEVSQTTNVRLNDVALELVTAVSARRDTGVDPDLNAPR